MKLHGKKIPPWALYGGGAVVAAGGVLYLRHRSAAAAGSSSSSAIDPVTGLPVSQDSQVDPATGMTYLAEAQQYGSVAAAEAAVSGSYQGAAGSPYGPQDTGTPSAGSGGGGGTPGPGSFTSNAQWAQATETDLASIGYAETDVASAVGRYLAKLPLSAAQANLIQVAVAEEGPPPVGTFPIIPQPSGGGGGGGGGKAHNPVKGLHVTHAAATSLTVSWDASAGASGYEVTVTEGGKTADSGKTATTTYHAGGLKRKTAYEVRVRAQPGAAGAADAHITAHTR